MIREDKSRNHYQLIVVGGGPAGMAAAVGAAACGVEKILLLDRNERMGGVLPQCIHDGFGMYLLGHSLTGPEYAELWQRQLAAYPIDCLTSATVLNIDYKKPFKVDCLHRSFGEKRFTCDTLVLAVGCRERTLGQMRIPGGRPAGIYTAGAAQYMMNVQNYLPGKSVVILGSGDIGLIMARRLTLEGARVKLILGEKASGLPRNYTQCVHDFDIPFLLGYTVLSTHGFKRLKGVTIAPLLPDKTPDLSQKQYVPCDTLLVATGLIAETELWQASGISLAPNCGIDVAVDGSTGIDGVFACGNVNKIYDLVDDVSVAGIRSGRLVAQFLLGRQGAASAHVDINGVDVLHLEREGTEPEKKYDEELKPNQRICVLCPRGCKLVGEKRSDDSWQITGSGCEKGLQYGQKEFVNPERILTTTVKVSGGGFPLVSAHSQDPLPKTKLLLAMKQIRRMQVAAPVKSGDVLCSDLAGTGIALIAGNTVHQV